MSQITTHVLDTSRGQPARGLRVTLARQDGGQWIALGDGVTDQDGRVSNLLASDSNLPAGPCKLTFDTGAYYAAAPCFYPQVEILFSIAANGQHYHVPLLLSPFGYSTYRGS